MSIIDQIKTALRISHNKLDSELEARISAARAEMVRVGVEEAIANDDDDPLVLDAVKTYCQYAFTDDEKKREGFYNSWVCQIDGLRKSRSYRRP